MRQLEVDNNRLLDIIEMEISGSANDIASSLEIMFLLFENEQDDQLLMKACEAKILEAIQTLNDNGEEALAESFKLRLQEIR